jgi:iron complex transport system permease protein
MKLSCLLPCILLATIISLWLGVGDTTLMPWRNQEQLDRWLALLWDSRLPRTLAVLFAGAATAVCGQMLQMLLQNRFVEPSMVGTVEGACFGMLIAMVFLPGLSVFGKVFFAFAGALAATGLFMLLLSRLKLRSVIIVPLTGIILSGVIDAVTNFIAFRFDLQQSLASWRLGDFSQILAGRWELLWLALALTLLAGLIADRFSVAGLGKDSASSLGLNYHRTMTLGLVIIAAASASVVATVGVIPFLGLVIPNMVSLLSGDNLRRTVPLVALSGALLTLICDILGRVVHWPFEVPIAVVIGILGSLGFLYLLARERVRLG